MIRYGLRIRPGDVLVTLKLDHDAHNSRRLALTEMVRRAERAGLVIDRLTERRSASGRGWHRVLQVWAPDQVTASQLVTLQLLFGSDPLREAYNYNRACIVDAKQAPEYWQRQASWDVLYKSPYPWRVVEAKVLAAHRERNGDARTVNARDRKKG